MATPGGNTRYTKLILLSGGIDSTYLLAHTLRETQDRVVVHHVHLINTEGRHQAEAEACRKIVDFCRSHYRDFAYSESTVDRSKLRAPGYDVITVAAEGGIAASNDMIVTGHMPDFWMLGINQEEAEQIEDQNKAVQGGVQGQGRLTYLLAAMAATCFPNAPPKYLRPPLRPKRDLVAYLGPALAGMCWTCRRPVARAGGWDECGTCQTCLLMQQIRTGG